MPKKMEEALKRSAAKKGLSREGQVVLDPFMGSGTTGMAAKKIGRDFIGIEREADYCAIARVRIKAIKPNLTLNLK